MSSALDRASTAPRFDPELAEALKFTQDDLAANAAGQLSAAQAGRLYAAARSSMLIRLALALVFTVLGVFFGVTTGDLLNIILAATVVGSLLWLIWRGWQASQADLAAGTVRVVEGEANPASRRGLSGMFKMVTEVKVGDERLQLAPDGQQALKSRGLCRVYYTPNANEIVAAEPMPTLDPVPVADVHPEQASDDAGSTPDTTLEG